MAEKKSSDQKCLTPEAQAYAAFARAQAEMKPAPLNAINPHYKHRYADLSAVREATLPALTAHGLAVVQELVIDDAGSFRLRTRIIHGPTGIAVSECVYPLPVLNNPHQMGAAITYARRYSWATATGIASEEDDDANAVALDPRAQTQAPQPARKAAPHRKQPAKPQSQPAQQQAPAATITPEELEELQGLIMMTNTDVVAVCRSQGVNSLAELTPQQAAMVKRLLEKKLAKMEEAIDAAN